MVVSAPFTKFATASVDPVSSKSCGVPDTETGSENVIFILMTSPSLQVPSDNVEVIETTEGIPEARGFSIAPRSGLLPEGVGRTVPITSMAGTAKFVPITEDTPFHPASPYAISKCSADLIGRFYAEAYDMKILTTRMFTHTGPRRGDVFAESSFAKQIAMIEADLIPPIVKVGNLESLRTVADVRDAVRAYHMMLTIKPIKGEYYNIGGNYNDTKLYDTLGVSKTASESEIKKQYRKIFNTQNEYDKTIQV